MRLLATSQLILFIALGKKKKELIGPNSVQSQLYDTQTSFVCVTEQELLASLKMTILGISSPLHTWNSSSERFLQSGTGNNLIRNSIIVDGKDEIVTSR